MDTPARLERIERLFHAALERAPQELATFLEGACEGNAALRREVESLLDSYHQAEDFLQTPASARSAAAIADQALKQAEALIVGERIGPYRVLREIGRGGMGAVYLAARADGQYEQQVAIKVIKRGLDTEFLLRRFRRERQILANLVHPYIARLLDGGMTADGRPFFVMEYVEGEPIDKYADAHRLSHTARLELFRTVCAAVSYAHQRRIIHRDLKPGNILITPEGTPKLLDFGVAKLLDAEPDTPSTASATPISFGLMTPEFASPEQLRGLPPTAASDVYSLGVLLYKLLTGHHPYKFQSRVPHQVLQTVLASEPPKPSVAIAERMKAEGGRMKDIPTLLQPSAFSLHPSGVPHPSALRGDLDNIVLMALRKDPARRYTSVEQFAEDIRRHQAGLPIYARKDTIVYRGVKFFQRHQTYTLITLAVALLCLLFGLWLGLSTKRPPANTAVAVLPFVNASQDPAAEYVSDGITDSLIDSLSRLPQLTVPARNSVFHYKGQALDPASIGQKLGVTAILSGSVTTEGEKFSISAELIETRTSQTIWNKQYRGRSAEILLLERQVALDVTRALGVAASGAEPSEQGHTESAEAYYHYLKGRYFWNKRGAWLEKGIAYFQRATEQDPRYALAYSGQADSYSLLGVYQMISPREAFTQAQAAALQALALDPNLAEAHASLAAVNWLYGWDWAGAEREFKRAIELNPKYPTVHHWYGLYLAEMGRFAEALAAEQRALQLDPFSPIINADLGRVLYYARRYQEAAEQYQKTREIDLASGGDALYVYEQMGATEQWFSIMEQGQWDSHPSLKKAYLSQGMKGFCREYLKILKRDYPDRFFYGRAELHARLGEKDQALEMLYRAYEERGHGLAQLKVNPVLDPLRSDPRFAELLRRMNFAP